MRARSALSVMVAALALLALGAPPWFSARLPGPVQGELDVAVSGAEAVGALGGVALVLLAGGAALGLVGSIGRRVVGVLVASAGAVVAILVTLVVRAPGEALRSSVASSTGVSAVPEHVVVSTFPAVTIALAVLVVGLGSWHASGRGRWPAPGARHDRGSASIVAAGAAATSTAATTTETIEIDDPASAWDALSEGADPS